jgi:peptide/nickel transport system ATP-binding protein
MAANEPATDPVPPTGSGVLMSARGLRVVFGRGAGAVTAVDDVDLDLHRGEILGLVGESGSGKSTVGRCLLRLITPGAGTVRFDGMDVLTLGRRNLKALRRRLQIVFQDSESALDPRMTVGEAVREGLDIHNLGTPAERREQVAAMLERVGLDPDHAARPPHRLSGGQRQRVAIARALVVQPEVVVADEPVSALDASIQAQILDLIADLRRDLRLTLLFISHDLSVVRAISDRVAVMYAGRIVEIGPAGAVFDDPRHPYTRMLLDSIPVPDPDSPMAVPAIEADRAVAPAGHGCTFAPRCAFATEDCARLRPPATPAPSDRRVACLHHHDLPPYRRPGREP